MNEYMGQDPTTTADIPKSPDEKKDGLTVQEGAGFIQNMWETTSGFLTDVIGMAHSKGYQEREYEYELKKAEVIPGVPGSTPTNVALIAGVGLLAVLLLARRR